jgi:2-aminophenol/2-amino-5-chlorophenol 1,6-dioxygenase subunit alpha
MARQRTQPRSPPNARKAAKRLPAKAAKSVRPTGPPPKPHDGQVRSSLPPGQGAVVAGFIVPGMPHPYLVPDANPAYRRIRDAYADVRKQVAALKPDIILLYSTQWLSVIGHQVQVRERPEWNHVDPEWHELGSIPYRLWMDKAFGEAYVQHGEARGLEMRTVDYHGFPIDTGTVVALKCITPKNEVPASVVSCNMYADRAETIVLGKAAVDAVKALGKRAVAIAVTNLSNRMHTDALPFKEDRIHSLKDDEWNRKYLEFLGRGRLEDASQLAREFSSQANGDQKMKAIWWLAAVMGSHNRYDGKVFAYEPVYGAGCALVGLTPTQKAAADKEYDEDQAEYFGGDRNVLAPASGGGATQLNVLTMEEADKWSASKPNGSSAEPEAEVLPRPAARTEGPRGGSPLLEESPSAAPRTEKLPWPGPKAPRPAQGQARQGRPQIPQIPQTNPTSAQSAQSAAALATPDANVISTQKAPVPYAAYAHARRVGDTLYLAGIGPRDPKTNATVGGPVRDAKGNPLPYDVKAQTRQTIENIRTILAESGCSLEDVFDVSAFLIDMDRDFKAFNEVYNEYFGQIQPTRTTVEVRALPGPIAVELKVVAKVRTGAGANR